MTRAPARPAAHRAAGFTLLEVMIAVAILSMTLVTLLSIVTSNIRATHHAKLTTTATFLARSKMVDLEDQVLENGFSTSDESATGTFKEQGHGEFRWDSLIERVELPADAALKQRDEAQDKAKDEPANPMSLISGFLGGMMSSFIEPIRLGLQEAVRRVTVHVTWDETGRLDQTIEVVQYLADPSKLDAALTGGGAATGAAGAAGTPAAGSPTSPAGLFGAPSITPTGTK
ncbi:MAG TPA: prepilin-type N-terminal cleavage/methylation domain-containing protein [Polyangia bacterium]|jgi:general secretion pathway protein I